MSVVAKSANYTVVETDNGNTLAVDASGGDITITLLPAGTAKNGFTLTIIKTDSSPNLVIIDGDGTEKINGVETLSDRAQYGAAGIICDGAAWFAVDRTMNTQVGQSKDGMFMVSETQADFNLGSGTAPGSVCTGHNRAYRSVNAAGTGTIRVITINNNNDIVIGGEPQTSKVYLDTDAVIVKRTGTPTVVFDNDGGTVANRDFVGEMTFKRTGFEYGSIKALITDKTAGSEDGRVTLNLRRAGTLTTAINVDFNADTNNPISLYVAGGEYRVTAGAADSGGTGYRALRIPN